MSPRQTICETSCDRTSSRTAVNASKFEWMSLMTAMAFCMGMNTSLGEYRQPDERKTPKTYFPVCDYMPLKHPRLPAIERMCMTMH